MVFGREMAMEMEIDRDVMWAVNQNNIDNGIWTKRDGTKISIREMTRSHIRNCISMLENGNSPFAERWIQRFKNELSFREYIEKITNGEL